MKEIKFKDEEHKAFYEKFVPSVGNDDYFKSVIYLLGLSSDTRGNLSTIFNPEKKEIYLSGLEKGWQTGSTMKITRLAFNLWNGMVYDSVAECENGKMSGYYAVDEIFCCSYAPYFFEAIKLRYPDYFSSC